MERNEDETSKNEAMKDDSNKEKQKLQSDREEMDKFVYDSSITYSPKHSSIRPKYYHNFITKKIFSDKSFSLSNENHKKTSSVIYPIKSPKKFRHPVNKTTVLNLNDSNLLTKKNGIIMKTEPIQTTATSRSYMSYGNFINSSLNQTKLTKLINNKTTNKKEEICKFYVEILRRVELINFRRNMVNKNSSTIQKNDIIFFFLC